MHDDPHHVRHCFDYLRQALMVCLLVSTTDSPGFDHAREANSRSVLLTRTLRLLTGRLEDPLDGGLRDNAATMKGLLIGQRSGDIIRREGLIDHSVKSRIVATRVFLHVRSQKCVEMHVRFFLLTSRSSVSSIVVSGQSICISGNGRRYHYATPFN